MTIKAVFFNIDGTLANTTPHLAFTLNEVLKKHNKPTLPIEKIRPIVSNGGEALIKLGFHVPHDHIEFESLKNEFLEFYQQNLAIETPLFTGIAELLNGLEAQNIKWSIVTNKPSWLTMPLLDAHNLTHRAGCIVCGDTLHVKKPNPKPLLYACEQTGHNINESIYIGSTERDILTGSRAQMRTGVSLFGDIEEAELPQNWGADRMINSPIDILLWINEENKITPLQNKEAYHCDDCMDAGAAAKRSAVI